MADAETTLEVIVKALQDAMEQHPDVLVVSSSFDDLDDGLAFVVQTDDGQRHCVDVRRS